MSQSSNNCEVFFSWFDVSYDCDKPHGSIDEINGKSADINHGQGGEYVWLTPRRASRPGMMVNNIWTDIRGDSINGKDDLAKGAGGDYRFLSWSNDMNAKHFITDLALWRCDDSQSDPPAGWHGKTGDINDRRGGDYLYLVWRTKEYTGQK